VKTIIVGCGRVGSVLADALDRIGHEVVVLDLKTTAFDRLPDTFRGVAVRGDGTDEDTLRRAGAESADLFMAMTEGDNRNVMSAQLATEALGAKRVIAKINDPLRAAAYAELGITTLCRTNLMASAVSDFLGLNMTFGPGLSAPTGQHPGGEHHLAGHDPLGAGPGGASSGADSSPAGPASASPAGSAASFSAGSAVPAPTGPTSAPLAPVTSREG
jgi:trk system potassium uptake protein TrkA